MRPPLRKLDIPVSEHGFYAGFSKDVAVSAKLLIMALVVWAVAFPENAASALGFSRTPPTSKCAARNFSKAFYFSGLQPIHQIGAVMRSREYRP